MTEEPRPSEALKREQVSAEKNERRAAHEAAEGVLLDDMEKAHAQRMKTTRKNTRRDQRTAIVALGQRLSRLLGRRGARG